MNTLPVLALDDAPTIRAESSARQLIDMLLLTAIMDRATQMQLVPTPEHHVWRFWYLVEADWYELVPVPLQVPVAQEVRRLLCPGLGCRLWSRLRRLTTTVPDMAHLLVMVKGQPMDLFIQWEPLLGRFNPREKVTFYFPRGELPAEQARQLIVDLELGLPDDGVMLTF